MGRFGWKAQQATLLAFAGDAYINEMGISNDLFRKEPVGNVSPEHALRCQPSATPEDTRDTRTGLRGIDQFENLLPIGRAGMFKYNNQDHAMATGLLAARTAIGLKKFDPWRVNIDAEYHESGPTV